MPIQIDRAAARALAPRFDDALELVLNEFSGLDGHQQYRNAFARLLKPDPLQRVLMMGTCQRDRFVPELRTVIGRSVPKRDGHILDVGAGDGQTFALAADAVPDGTRVSLEEPNPDYVAAYDAWLRAQPRLQAGMSLVAGFDEIDTAGATLPADGSVDLCLAMHMLFFVADVGAALTRMVRFLKPGGSLFVVIADETIGYTGRVVQAFVDAGGTTGDDARHLDAMAERRRLVGSPADGDGQILAALERAGLPVTFETELQPSRLYGHTLGDLIALSAITVLSQVDDVRKFHAAADLMRSDPEAVDLRIEDEGPRTGMWSVTQPQWVAVLRRSGPNG